VGIEIVSAGQASSEIAPQLIAPNLDAVEAIWPATTALRVRVPLPPAEKGKSS